MKRLILWRPPVVCAVLCWASCLSSAVEPPRETVVVETLAATNPRFDAHWEHLLGTSVQLQIHAPNAQVADKVEQCVTREIERLASVLSRYDAESELSRWMAAGAESFAASEDLVSLLREAERWIETSGGVFHPSVAGLSGVWRDAASKDQMPRTDDLTSFLAACRGVPWRWDADGHVAYTGQTGLDFDALAKGVIIDRVMARVAANFPDVSGILLNIGGDLRVMGAHAKTVAIADPRADEENGEPLTYLQLADRAMATSGGYRRGFQIGDRNYSHILDPRSGQPVDHLESVTVIADDAATADVLATILSVLPVNDGLELVARLGNVDCMLVTPSGKQFVSSRWHRYELGKTLSGRSTLRTTQVAVADAQESDQVAKTGAGRVAVAGKTPPAFPAGQEMLVELELNRLGGGGYRRPYVAVWVEDEKGFPVRTISLWLQTGKGSRWHRDLRRWFHGDEMRQLVDETSLIDTISSATRSPGKYKLVWDGRDDLEQLLPAGKFTLFLETAREHGTYQLMRYDFELNGKPFAKTLDGNPEIKAASVKFRAATPKNGKAPQ